MTRAKNSPKARKESRSNKATRSHSKRPSRAKSATKRPARRGTSKNPDQSKTARMLALLGRAEGATLAELTSATGWQAHSVRGFLSGTVRKRLNQPLKAEIIDGERRYRIEADQRSRGAS